MLFAYALGVAFVTVTGAANLPVVELGYERHRAIAVNVNKENQDLGFKYQEN